MRKALTALALFAVIALLSVVLRPSSVSLPPANAKVALSVRVSGNQLVDQTGAKLQLRGVNHSGAQYACAEGTGLFDAPATDATITAMKAWGVNAVRVPLNETCWLGSTQIRPGMRGSTYRRPEIDKVAAKAPVVIGEMGDSDCTHKFTDKLTMWADTRGMSYLAWGWVVGACADEPSLLKDYQGTPSGFGAGVKAALQKKR